VIVLEPGGGGLGDFRSIVVAGLCWTGPPIFQPTLTSSEREFMPVREGRMGFQDDIGVVPGAARKRKSLFMLPWAGSGLMCGYSTAKP